MRIHLLCVKRDYVSMASSCFVKFACWPGVGMVFKDTLGTDSPSLVTTRSRAGGGIVISGSTIGNCYQKYVGWGGETSWKHTEPNVSPLKNSSNHQMCRIIK